MARPTSRRRCPRTGWARSRSRRKACSIGLDALLAQCGTSKGKLLSATLYCNDSRHFDEVNTRWDAWVPWHDPPGCQYVVAKLRNRDHKVAIQVTAAI